MTKGMLIAFIVVSTIFVTNANYSCFNSFENQLVCNAGKVISFLPAPLREVALRTSNALVGMISNVGDSVIQVLIQHLSQCPIDTRNVKTIAKSFNFRLYYPDERQINLTGLEFMNFCDESNYYENVDEIVYLFHGILTECPSLANTSIAHMFKSETAFVLAKNLNALVILIDWGSSGLSCCNYIELTFCYLDIITDWITNQVINCADNGATPPIERMTFIGHGQGAHYSGYVCQKIFQKTGKKCKKLYGLDTCSLFYSIGNGIGQCVGLQSDAAEYTMNIQTSVIGIRTRKTDIAMVNVLSNKNESFCQHGVPYCDPIGNHLYAVTPIFDLLAKDVTLNAAYQLNQQMEHVTFYEYMDSGIYFMEAKDNQALLNAN